MAEAIHRSYGNLARAARRLGWNLRTILKRVAADPDLKAVVADAREGLVDLAESALVRALKAEEPAGWADIWTLKTMGRDRGWAEGPAGSPWQPPAAPAAFDPPPDPPAGIPAG